MLESDRGKLFMTDSCGPDCFDPSHQLRRTTLLSVLWINAIMFAVEFAGGVLADSSALGFSPESLTR